MKYKLLRFSLLGILSMLWGLAYAQQPEVSLDFTDKTKWDIPTSGTNTELGSYTDGTYTIKLVATNNYKMNTGYLILGKKDSYLELPPLDFDVEMIEVVGREGASGSVKQVITNSDGEQLDCAETTGATGTNTYRLKGDDQKAGTYRLVVNSDHNTQITKINIYKVGTTTPPETATVSSFNELQQKCTSTTATPAAITFNGEQVVFVNGSNAFLADAEGYGALIYTRDHGLEAGQTLTGTINANIQLYQGNAEITGFSTEGLTIGSADVVAAAKSVGDITTANQSTLVILKKVVATVSEDGKTTTLSDGQNTITYYDKFKTGVALEDGKSYNITGIVVVFNGTLEICPRTADDVEAAIDDVAPVTFPITATWDFTNADVVTAVTALSGSTEAGTIAAVEDNGLLLTVEANGQTIRDNTNSIQTGTPVVFKVPVQGKKDVVTVVGYSAPHFAYSVAGTDATEATTVYTATAADVSQGYVEVINKGQYLISISVTQNEDDTPDEPQDITGTWSYADADVMEATIALSGSNEAGEVEATEKNGLMMTVEANGASFRNNGNNIQVRSGAVFKIPVRSAGDLVTVKGYPGYSYYTIGNSTEELNDENTYTAKRSDAEAGYVAVTSVNDNNYYLSLSVVQYAPKEAVTLDNEMATVTFPFNEGTEGQTATFSNPDYFLNSKVTYGSNLTLKDKYHLVDAEVSTDDNKVYVDQTRFEPSTKLNTPDEASAVRFAFTPKPGFTFKPTKVAINVTRYGTDNGLVDVTWEVAGADNIVLAKEVKPARNNANPSITKVSYDIADAPATEGTQVLLLHLYSLQENKQFGLDDILIEGIMNGTEQEVPILASFKVNGTEYAAEDVFGDLFEATFELQNGDAMVSAQNPLTDVTAASGELGEVTYEGTDTQCSVTIPVTAGETTIDYVLNVVYKPYFTLSYLDVEGNVLTTQQVEKDAPIGEFACDISTVPATKEGYKARGWFKQGTIGEKYTTDDLITANTTLYAVQTEIEESSTHKKYTFDLADKFFYAEDHEAFNPSGNGFYWHDAQHGWAFKNGNTVDLLVGPKATITIVLCQYGSGTAIVVKKDGEVLATLPGIADGDGGTAVYNYEGEAGTLTLEMQCSGEMYIHSMKIVNTAEVNFESQDNWYFVKAGDAGSLLEVLEVVNGINANRDAERSFIFLPNGTYDLDATVKTAITGHNISIIGQSMEGTVITTKPDNSIEGLGKADMLQNSGTNLYMQDLTLQNALDYYTAGSAGRAPVLADAGNRTIGKNVRMLSYQDTYYSSNSKQQAYWETCDIHGTVDFICGGGDIRFQNTQISLEPRARDGKGGRTVTAPTSTTSFGYVFDGCNVVDLAQGKGDWNYGRTWQNQPVCVYLNTTLDSYAKNTLIATRWVEKGMNGTDPKLFGEYATKDDSGNDITPASNLLNSYGGSFQTILSAEQAETFAYNKMFTDWDPATLAKQVTAPDEFFYDNGTVVCTIKPQFEYPIALFNNDVFVGFLDQYGNYAIDIDPASDKLTVRATNAMGGMGKPVVVKGIATGINEINGRGTAGSERVYDLQGRRINSSSSLRPQIIIRDGKKAVIK